MKAFKLKYADGSSEIKYALSALALIRKYELCTRDHVETRIFQLSGEQEAIALANLGDQEALE